MIANTIPSKFTQKDRDFLANFEQQQKLDQLAREAQAKDDLFQSLRDYAYQLQNFGLATRLERYSANAHKRLNRRFNNLQIH
jgi:hypothetical protein